MTAKHLSTWLRRLVPESPKCARFAAGSALAALALQTLCHLASLGQAALARLNAWLLAHGLRDIPPCDLPADGTIPAAPVTYQPAIMGATVMAFALLAVAHTVRFLGGEDREGKEKVSARRRGLIGAAAVLGGMQIAMSVIGVFVLRASAIGSLCTFFGPMAAYFSSLALGIGVAALPFCLLRLHGSVLKAPCDGADLRKLERLLSLAFGVCVAVVSTDIIKDAVFWIPRSPYPFLVGASFLFALLTPLSALCVLWSCLTLLRGAAAGMCILQEPGRRIIPFAVLLPCVLAGALTAARTCSYNLFVCVASVLYLLQVLLIGWLLYLMPRGLNKREATDANAAMPVWCGAAGLGTALAALVFASLGNMGPAAGLAAAAGVLSFHGRKRRPRLVCAAMVILAVVVLQLLSPLRHAYWNSSAMEDANVNLANYDWAEEFVFISAHISPGNGSSPDEGFEHERTDFSTEWGEGWWGEGCAVDEDDFWTAEEQALLSKWGADFQADSRETTPVFHRKAPLASISGLGFSIQFHEESVLFFPASPSRSLRLRARKITPLDRQVLELIRSKVREKVTRESSTKDNLKSIHGIQLPPSATHFQTHGNRWRHGGSAAMFECEYADLADWMSTLSVRTKMDPANGDAGNPCTNGYNCWPTNAQTWVPGNREFDGFTNTWSGATHPVVMLSCDSPTGDWLHVEIWRKSHDGNAVVKIYTDWN